MVDSPGEGRGRESGRDGERRGWGGRSVRVRAAGAMATLSGLAALRAGRRLWKLPARPSSGLPGCWLRRGYIVGRAEVRTSGFGPALRAGGREGDAGH